MNTRVHAHPLDSAWRCAGVGLFALPLAFVALPVYVHLPHWYATQWGVPLTALGMVLLFSRLADALVDPWLGRLSDRLFARATALVLTVAGGVASVLCLSFVGLFFPPEALQLNSQTLLIWLTVLLTLSHGAYSALGIMHQSWVAMLGGSTLQRSRLVSWREGLGLMGVLLASALPSVIGMAGTAVFLAMALMVGWWVWTLGVRPNPLPPEAVPAWGLPWRYAAFRQLMAVFVLNGVASAVPATLVMFFVQDRIQAPAAMQPWFLSAYFVSGALSLPLWLRCIARWGLPLSWLWGMGLSVASFAGVGALQAGDDTLFLWACVISGLALGADLAVPGTLLNELMDRLGFRGQAEGVFLGWWNLATKLNLALAAGCALPLLGWWGYAPGQLTPSGLQALTVAYVFLPCVLKLIAAAGLYVFFIRSRNAI